MGYPLATGVGVPGGYRGCTLHPVCTFWLPGARNLNPVYPACAFIFNIINTFIIIEINPLQRIFYFTSSTQK